MGEPTVQSGKLEFIILSVFQSHALPNEVHLQVLKQEGERTQQTIILDPRPYAPEALTVGNRVVTAVEPESNRRFIEAIYAKAELGGEQLYPPRQALARK